MDATQAQDTIQRAGYTVHHLEPAKADIGYDKFLVLLSGKSLDRPSTFTASFQSGLEKKWGEKTVEALFGGEISLAREADIYHFAHKARLPAPQVRLEGSDAEGSTLPFLLEEVLAGKPLKEYVAALPSERREGAYYEAVHKVGALFAQAHQAFLLEAYGDIASPQNDTPHYLRRLRDIVSHNLAWNGHERVFSAAELDKVRTYFKAALDNLEGVSFEKPCFVLANLHRGNVLLNESGEISGISQFNFAQAGIPAAEFYNAFWQFADKDVAPTTEVHAFLVKGYNDAGGQFDPKNETKEQVMRILDVNHFLRAATLYATKANDPMRNRWGKRFKDEILFPIIERGEVDYDLFSGIINEKWKG